MPGSLTIAVIPKDKARRDSKDVEMKDSREGTADAGAEDSDAEVDEDEQAMMAMMGFGGFGSTKGKKVKGNNVSAVYKPKKTEYRQYMYVIWILVYVLG